MNITIFGDDPRSMNIMAFSLQQEGYTVDCVNDRVALDLSGEMPLDLIILDADSLSPEILRRIHELRADTVIALLLICRECPDDQLIAAYQAGIDSHLIKPYSYQMLLAHVFARLRSARAMHNALIPDLQTSTLSIDPERHTVTLTESGISRQLTNLEFRLLYCLVANRGRVLSTETIIEKVWGYTGEGDRNLLKNLVSRLRSKVEYSSDARLITTVSGIGYVFRAE